MAIAVLGAIAVIWGLGRAFGWSKPVMLTGMLFAYIGGLSFELVRTGGSPAPLALLGGAAVLAGAYTLALRKLRARADALSDQEPDKRPAPLFRDAELERYARHIVLRELGGPGQKKLKEAKVLVIGAGGLGSPVLMYLAAAGVGTIGVIDDDTVDHSNLQRQVIHKDESIGEPKVISAADAMAALNPYVSVRPYKRRLTEDMAEALFADYDLIIDGTDNFETRYLSNRVAVRLDKPLVSGALAQWEGQLSVFAPSAGGPCYECVFPKAPEPGLASSCAEAGVVAALPGVIGTMMALEAIKIVSEAGQVMRGEMLIFDGLYGESRKVALLKREDCEVCGEIHA